MGKDTSYQSLTTSLERLPSTPMCDKSKIFNTFKKHILRYERFLNHKLKSIQSDNVTEFGKN